MEYQIILQILCQYYLILCCFLHLIETEIIFGGEDTISVAEDANQSPICFYNVLADHFVQMPQIVKSILDLIVQLWSQLFASNIFSLLFHKWVCIIYAYVNFPIFNCLWCSSTAKVLMENIHFLNCICISCSIWFM